MPQLSREEIAQIEVGHTTVSRGTARGAVAAFLLFISVPPLVDLVAAARGRESQAWPVLAALPRQIGDLVMTRSRAGHDQVTTRSLIVDANRLALGAFKSFEDELADASPVFAAMRPSAQAVLSGWLAAGNERVYQGRDGWLFFRPDVDYVIGPGFLDAAEMRRRRESTREWIDRPQPDPRPALVAFKRQLDARGIALVVVPTPVKPVMHPERLAGARAAQAPVENVSYGAWLADLQREGVMVLDLAAELARSNDSAYLATDTHWRPETVRRAAELLGAFIRTRVPLDDAATTGYRTETRDVTNVGDTAAMLDVSDRASVGRSETVTIDRVVDGDGAPWRPSRDADVLVLGDSFSNIYSLASMGWGDSAGLIEHLGHVLDRPIDRIVQNDNGSFATRERLRQDLATGTDRLRGKRVVVLQFAARELRSGDWKLIDLPQ